MRMDNATYWALKRREREAREAETQTRVARRARPSDRPEVIPTAENSSTGEGESYRDLQARAKELDIPANQSAEDLKAAIEKAAE